MEILEKIGSCPRCHCEDVKVLESTPQRLIFRCNHCHYIFGQERTLPFKYLRIAEKRTHVKSILALGFLIIILSMFLFLLVSGFLSIPAFTHFAGPQPSAPIQFASSTNNSSSTSFTLTTASPTTTPELLVNPKVMNYHYTLRGVSSEITFTVYGGLYNYLVSHEDSTVTYYNGQQPSDEEITRTVTLRYVNENIEQDELHNLANTIEQITPNEDDQARIAISLVQNILYDNSALASNNTQCKYPYEVLYSDTGVCETKINVAGLPSERPWVWLRNFGISITESCSRWYSLPIAICLLFWICICRKYSSFNYYLL